MLRMDDIPKHVADDIQGYALIYLQKNGIIKSSINENLMNNYLENKIRSFSNISGMK